MFELNARCLLDVKTIDKNDTMNEWTIFFVFGLNCCKMENVDERIGFIDVSACEVTKQINYCYIKYWYKGAVSELNTFGFDGVYWINVSDILCKLSYIASLI